MPLAAALAAMRRFSSGVTNILITLVLAGMPSSYPRPGAMPAPTTAPRPALWSAWRLRLP
jgi:hypothetical protein